jgi:hypothetical protein
MKEKREIKDKTEEFFQKHLPDGVSFPSCLPKENHGRRSLKRFVAITIMAGLLLIGGIGTWISFLVPKKPSSSMASLDTSISSNSASDSSLKETKTNTSSTQNE